jgi:hypothetical protein
MSEERRGVTTKIAAIAVLLVVLGMLAISLLAGRTGGPLTPAVDDRTFAPPTASVGRPAAFTVDGSVSGLVVGVWRTVRVEVTNPNPTPIRVTELTVEVTGSTDGCVASANFETRPAAAPFTVPAAAVAYPVPAAGRPWIRLEDTGTNQDACQNRSFGLVLHGSASKP